jgi:hypothetical protein
MERIPRIRKGCRPERAWLGFMKVRMKDHLRAAHSGPANRLWVTPPFVTDHHSERHRPGLKEPAIHIRRVGTHLRGIDLNLVLEPRQRPIRVDDQHRCSGRSVSGDLRGEFEEAVYVLHAFQKMTPKTSRIDIEVARRRYRLIGGPS